MTNGNPKYARPKEPLSFRDMVRRLLDDAGYAQYIHTLVLDGRSPDRKVADAAREELAAHFEPREHELKNLSLPQDVRALDCTGYTSCMLDFAAVRPRDEEE